MQFQKNGQRHIWLLAGTGEGPTIASLLIEQGWKVSVSVVSIQASWPYSEMSLTSLCIGPLQGVEGIKGFLDEALNEHQGFDWVIDATHPFAVEISSNLEKACREFGQNLLRYERPLEAPSRTFLIKDLSGLSNCSLQGKNILMALGARHLHEAVHAARQCGARVFARVLPTPESLKQSLNCLLPEDDLAVFRPLQGNQIGDLERALCRRWSISDVICRQSGGATQELWQDICHQEGINLWLISRPKLVSKVEVFHTFNAVMGRISISK
ncbi:precorrin-6A/cobalt-precorrin-6A reductase [Prochlorococcus sp. MIT 1307]|uniref:precorrin-6A/cobalt-precorrin-6A reductase n=1 Tax=Prochlorococcus sp. MIT 1307 TaxID=3096219 RepID=UPI002A75E5B8|nr:precorrin-6A/cobalt-precorrin-6A reductase [Prochlorococcus sp. MIT 1307]